MKDMPAGRSFTSRNQLSVAVIGPPGQARPLEVKTS